MNMISLNEISNFNKLKKYFDENKEKDWSKWLAIKELPTSKPGRQGLVGLFIGKDDTNNDIKYVFKLSQNINYLIQHELTIFKSINKLCNYVPHFCRGFGGIISNIDPKKEKNAIPLIHNSRKLDSKHAIEKEVLLMEYIPNAVKLYTMIKKDNIPDKVIFSLLCQVMLSIQIAQQKENFTHYDLHPNNILVKKCDTDLVMVYSININDKVQKYVIPTFGYYPIIIDYGFAYAKSMQETPLWPTMGHTDAGIYSDRFDELYDAKLFLLRMADEFSYYRKKTTKGITSKIKSIFKSIKEDIDMETGWETWDTTSCAIFTNELLDEINESSELFEHYDHYCIDILQTLAVLPLKHHSTKSLELNFSTFLLDFVKIENEIGSPFYSLYFLKNMIEVVRGLKDKYVDKTTSKEAVNYFTACVNDILRSIINFADIKNVNYERLLCSTILLGKNIEGIYYEFMKNRQTKRVKIFKNVPFKKHIDVFNEIRKEFDMEYIMNSNTVVMHIDSINEKCMEITNLNYTGDLNMFNLEEIN